MRRMLVDTCVWLDLARTPSQSKNLDILENLKTEGELDIILPQIVLDILDPSTVAASVNRLLLCDNAASKTVVARMTPASQGGRMKPIIGCSRSARYRRLGCASRAPLATVSR